MTATAQPQGSSFGNAINYIYEGRLDEHKDKKEALLLHSDNIRVPRDAEDLKGRNRMKADFIFQAEQHKQYGNAHRKNYVGHHSLNFSVSDIQDLGPKKIEQITKDYIKDAGIDQTQYIAVAHQDTDLYHVHIIFNRAKNDKTLYNDWRERNKTAERAVALNLKYDFVQVKKQVEMANSPEVLAIRSGHEDIQKLRADELLSRAKNLHHLSKICEADGRVFKEHGGVIMVGELPYKKADLQAVFYDNRSEDRAKARQRHLEETTQRKEERGTAVQKDYEIKENRRQERANKHTALRLEAEQRRKVEALEKSLQLKAHIAGHLKVAKSERQFIEDLGKAGIKVTEGEDKAMYVFEGSASQTAMSKYEIRQQVVLNTTLPTTEQSRTSEQAPSQTPEPNISTNLGGGEMAGQKASGSVRKLDGSELDQEEQKKEKKRKRGRGFGMGM